MKIEKAKYEEHNKELNIDGSSIVCNIELTLDEVKAIKYSLGTTMCNGNELTISMKLEDELVDVLKYYWDKEKNK